MKPAQAAPAAKAAPAARLGFQDTTVSFGNPWDSVSQASLPFRFKRAEKHDAKADALQPGSVGAQWHRSRAAGLRRTLADKLGDCGHLQATLVNRETGEVLERPLGCGVRLCPKCAKDKAKKTYRRLKLNLDGLAALQESKNCKAHMLTLTVRSRDDLAQVARIFRAAWPRFRASWQWVFKSSLPFLRFEEIAAGRTGKGHLHWHLLAFGPKFFPLKNAQRWWRKACARARNDLGLTADDQGQNLDLSIGKGGQFVAPGAASIASYSGKIYNYIAKESADLGAIAAEKVAEYLDATYGLRIFTAARGMLAPAAASGWFLLAIGPAVATLAPDLAPETSANGARAPPTQTETAT